MLMVEKNSVLKNYSYLFFLPCLGLNEYTLSHDRYLYSKDVFFLKLIFAFIKCREEI